MIEAVKRMLVSHCTHPQVLRLQRGRLREEALDFVDGGDPEVHMTLRAFMGEMAFGFASERQVEGGHASVNLRASGKRNRTEAYDSLTLRMPEIEHELLTDAAFLPELIEALNGGRNPAKALAMLSLRDHPSASLAKHNWDTIHRKIVYHADPHSMYRSRPRLTPDEPPPPMPPSVHAVYCTPGEKEQLY